MKPGIEMAIECVLQTAGCEGHDWPIQASLAMHAMRQGEIDELVECLSQCEDVLATLAKEPGG